MVVSELFDYLADFYQREWFMTGHSLSQLRNSLFFELFGVWQAEDKKDGRQ